jgi:hypothetical protein
MFRIHCIREEIKLLAEPFGRRYQSFISCQTPAIVPRNDLLLSTFHTGAHSKSTTIQRPVKSCEKWQGAHRMVRANSKQFQRDW